MRKLIALLLFVATGLSGTVLLTPPAQAASTNNTAHQTGKLVSQEPSRATPNILDGSVYSIAQVGNTIIVGGSFTQVRNPNSSTTMTRTGALAFNATTGVVSPTFTPQTNGTVYKVLPAANGTSVYLGGRFTSAFGTTVKNLLEADVASGAVVTSFSPPNLDGDVRDLEVTGNRLWVAGKFTHIGGKAQRALGTLSASSGSYDSYFTGVLAGLHNPTLSGSVTDVLQISTNSANTQLAAVGNFTTVDGQDRSQIVKIDISGGSYALSPWSTNLYKSSCSAKFDTYMSDVEYSPNGAYFAVSTSGAYGGSTSSPAGTSGCDVVARFESSTETLTTPTWTAYTGGDSTWTVEVTDSVIYTGGHMRWQNNPGAGDAAGPGAVERTGIASLNPVNGMTYSWNPTRTRGVGIQDMLANDVGLYVGSDTTSIGQTPGNMYHADIALLPLAGGETLPTIAPAALPADIYTVATGGSQLVRRTFSGTGVSSTTNAPTGPGWNTATGGFMVNGTLYKLNNDGSVTNQTFDGTTYGTASPVATADAIVVQTGWHTDVKTITTLFYSNGFIYYTKSGSNVLYRRGFEAEDDIVGQQRFSTDAVTGVSYSSMRGAFVANGKLYFSNTSGQLFASTWNAAAHAPVAGTVTQVSGSGKDSQNWASRSMFPYQGTPGAANQLPTAAASVTCDKLACSFDASASSDPEGSTLTYDWDFGDNSPHGSGKQTTHSYADAGDRQVTLTVTDNKGGQGQVTKTASPTNQADSIGFVASANTNGNRSNHTVKVPTTTQSGDQLLLFFSANSVAPTYSAPTGWTLVQEQTGSSFLGRVYRRTATASDAGSTVTITGTSSGAASYTKSDMTVAAYRGVDVTTPVNGSAGTVQNTASATHQTPTLTAPDGTSWLVSYWTDKSSSTTGWTGPAGQTQRSLGGATASSGHMSSLLDDSNATVSSGLQGGLNATATSSAPGLTMSILLAGSSGVTPPANGQPVADAGVATCTDLTCTFDGESSSDPNGDPITYDWNFGPGEAPNSTDSKPSHTFASGGAKDVTLTVTDSKGASSTAHVTANPTAPAVNQAPTAHAGTPACTDLTCSFNGSSSTDPNNDTLTYTWTFDDGTTDTGAIVNHTYTSAGAKPVTLTVSDGSLTDNDTTTANPTDPGTPTTNNVTYVDSAATNGNRTSHAVTVPNAVHSGDTLVLLFTANTTSPTYTGPAGWTPLQSLDGSGVVVRAYTKTATATDAGSSVRVTSSGYAKSDITVAAYSGTVAVEPVTASAAKVDNTSGGTHVSPVVNAANGNDWLVTYWGDKSSSTTGWTAPSDQTIRSTSIGTSTGHVDALLTDSAAPVPAGPEGGLTATANSTSTRGVSVSLLLESS